MFSAFGVDDSRLGVSKADDRTRALTAGAAGAAGIAGVGAARASRLRARGIRTMVDANNVHHYADGSRQYFVGAPQMWSRGAKDVRRARRVARGAKGAAVGAATLGLAAAGSAALAHHERPATGQ